MSSTYKDIKEINGYVLRYVFSAHNRGTAFARNYDGSVRVQIVSWPNDEFKVLLDQRVTSCRNTKEADYYARKYIRENNMRGKLKEMSA